MNIMNLFESPKTKDIEAHLKNLVSIAKMDGNMDTTEIEKIQAVAAYHGISEKKVEKILKYEGPVTGITGTKDEKFEKLYDIITVISADGILDDSEMAACETLAIEMGFSNVIAAVMIRQLVTGVLAEKSKERIKEEAESFLNY